MRSKRLYAALITLVLLPIGHAMAQQLVQDGGFEAATPINGLAAPGSFGDGWSVTSGYASVLQADDPTGVPHSGSHFAYLDYGYGLNTISQDLTTTPGQAYTISFYVADTAPNFLKATFGGTVLFVGTAPANGVSAASDYVLETFTATASSTSTVLAFDGSYAGGNGTDLDDVSVTPFGAAPVPEPNSILLLGIALTGAALCRHRRRAS